MSNTRCCVALILPSESFYKRAPMFMTKPLDTGSIDLYSPSISIYKPGQSNVVRSVTKPESVCSGVTNLTLSASSPEESAALS